MKALFLPVFFLFMMNPVFSQDVVRLISVEICNCIDTIENMDSLEAKFDRCFSESIDAVIELLDENMQEVFLDEATLNSTIEEVYERFLSYCPRVRKFILEDKEKEFYRMSSSPTAREYFENGNKAFESKDYKNAVKYYSKALKADKQWVLALDNLGLTYRTMGNYKKAVKCYERSLQIYPEGRFALQNQAVALTYLNELLRALENYDQLIYLYPEDPEGYFGMALISFMIKDYEKALDFAFHTHRMYVSGDSDLVKDTDKLISMIYDKMKEQGKDSVFFEKAKQFGINIRLNQPPE